MFHAQPRATKDLDILVKADPRNSAALYAALQEFGAPIHSLAPSDLTEPGTFFRMGRPPQAVDILPDISGVDFDDVLAAQSTNRRGSGDGAQGQRHFRGRFDRG